MRRPQAVQYRCLLLLSFLAVLAFASPALADLVTWNINGVTLEDGSTVTGSFVYNTESNLVDSWSIYVNPTLVQDFHFEPWNSQASKGSYLVQFDTGYIQELGSWTKEKYELSFQFVSSQSLASPGTIPLLWVVYDAFYQYWQPVNNPFDEGFPGYWVFDWNKTGTLDTQSGLGSPGYLLTSINTVPLPPTVLLLGTGLLCLGALRRRKSAPKS
jgi:hypothetical protein